MKYLITASVYTYSCDELYCSEYKFDTLEEALKIYDMFDGIETYNEFIGYELSDSKLDNHIIYLIEFIEQYQEYTMDDNDYKFIKGKYRILDLRNYYPDFWNAFNIVDLKMRSN